MGWGSGRSEPGERQIKNPGVKSGGWYSDLLKLSKVHLLVIDTSGVDAIWKLRRLGPRTGFFFFSKARKNELNDG